MYHELKKNFHSIKVILTLRGEKATMKRAIQSILLLFMFSLVKAPGIFAEPSISGFGGTLSDGSVITILGGNFGTHPDNSGAEAYINYKWDNFESGVINRVFTHTHGVGINLDNQRDGSTYNGRRPPDTQAFIGVGSSSTTDGYYTTFWLKVPDDIGWGEEEAKPQMKFCRIGNSYYGYPNVYPGKIEYSGRPYLVSIEPKVYNPWISDYSTIWDDGGWHRVEFWFRPSSGLGKTDGQVDFRIDGRVIQSDSTVRTDYDGKNTYSGYWHAGVIVLYECSNQVYFDDIYYDYTRARVELGNSPTFSACTHREIQIPINWSETSITVTVNKGSFSNGETAYLFVLDRDGNVNTNGYPVVIGDGGGDPTVEINATIVEGLTMAFSATPSGGTINAYNWDFGDGDTSTAATPQHEYDAGGSKTVTLTATIDGTDVQASKTTLVWNFRIVEVVP